MIEVRAEGGIHLPQAGIWLDPRTARDFAFVSHAHSDHIARHRRVLLSGPTSRLLGVRLSGERVEEVLPFGAPRDFDRFRATLLPAGHVLGASMLLLEHEEGSLLYTGDFNLRPGIACETAAWAPAETLVMETTFGLPRYRFPPTESVIASFLDFCRETLEEGGVPVVLAYSLGKAQEALRLAADAGMSVMVHGAIHALAQVYAELLPDFPTFERYTAGRVQGKVLICPPSAAESPMVRRIANRRTVSLTGWAMDPQYRFRSRCDLALPLSDHAGYDDLLRLVDQVAPRRVLTVHGFAEEFAADLRARGIEAWALEGRNQLDLPLRITGPSATAPGPTPAHPEHETSPPGPLDGFGTLCEALAATTSRLRKIAHLAAFLENLEPADLRRTVAWVAGNPLPGRAGRRLQTGGALLRRAVAAAARLPEAEVRVATRRLGDTGLAARELLAGRTRPEPWSFAATEELFEALAGARGPVERTDLLGTALARMAPGAACAVVKVLAGDLRIGLQEGLVEEAIARFSGAPIEAVREAAMLTGNASETAQLAREGRLADATLVPFRPIRVMLASPEPDAEAVRARFGAAFWIEDKFDGIRAQIHAAGGRAALYSRDLKETTGAFEEIARAAAGIGRDFIADAELVGFEEGRVLAFDRLQRRLGRRGADLFLPADVPVLCMVFDLLWLDGVSLLERPLRERRAALESVEWPPGFRPVEIRPASDPSEIDTAFDAARARGNEGLIIKDPASRYQPGRRGFSWIKLKRALATLDAVVVAAEWGHGRRHKVLSDYTFALRDGAGALRVLGKAYSGLTDAEITELTAHFLARTRAVRGRKHEVEPDVVLEIAFDAIRESPRHDSGLALRFPRIARIRTDKTPADIDTVENARTLLPKRGE